MLASPYEEPFAAEQTLSKTLSKKKCSPFFSHLWTHEDMQKCSWLHPSEEINSFPEGITGEIAES